MKVRKLNANGEVAFGRGRLDYLADSPEAVGQNVMTRLKLKTGEWFTDVSDGTPYADSILGEHKRLLYDVAIKSRILGTPGVTQIVQYESTLDPDSRKLKVSVTLDTEYGTTTVKGALG